MNLIKDVKDKITDKARLLGKNEGTLPYKDVFIGKIADVYLFLLKRPHASLDDVADFMGRGKESARKYLQVLIAVGMAMPEGGRRNRTYSAI